MVNKLKLYSDRQNTWYNQRKESDGSICGPILTMSSMNGDEVYNTPWKERKPSLDQDWENMILMREKQRRREVLYEHLKIDNKEIDFI